MLRGENVYVRDNFLFLSIDLRLFQIRWMKTNNAWSGRSALKPEYYQTWADYHIRYLSLMAAANLPLWGITTGNEPLNGEIWMFFVHFMSLGRAEKRESIENDCHRIYLITASEYARLHWFLNQNMI